MARAIWNGVTLAESEHVELVEGNVYFPPEAVNRTYLKASSTHTTCPWKGQASYFTIEVDGQINKDGAWYYPNPKPAAQRIQNYVAFWRGVRVER